MPPSLRNPYAYPGDNPGFDPTHPAAKGIRLSIVANPTGGIPRIITAPGLTSRTFTKTGTVNSAVYSFGPAITALTGTNYLLVPAINEQPASITVGGIWTVIGTSVNGVHFNNNGSSFANAVAFASGNSQAQLFVNGVTIAGGPTVTPGHTYFAAISYNGVTANFAVVDLSFPKIATAVTSSAQALALPSSSQYMVGTNDNVHLYALSYSINNYLSTQQLYQWAQAPWNFWYPPISRQIIYLSAKPNAPLSAGQADGQASVSGVSNTLLATAGHADGQASVTGVGSLITALSTAGQADGQATVAGVAGVILTAAGQANGQASVSGAGVLLAPRPDLPPPTIPNYLREMTYRHRMLGRSFEPTIHVIKDRPGPIRIIEFVGEMQGGS